MKTAVPVGATVKRDNRVVLRACIYLALFAALFITLRDHPPISSADYAAWVQAIGSIAAIVYAIRIASSQRREATRLEIKQRSGKLAAVRGITEHAVNIIGEAVVALLEREAAVTYVANYNARVFEDALRVLQQIPMLELGTVGAVEGVTLIKTSVGAMTEYLESLHRNPTLILQSHAQVAGTAQAIQSQAEAGRQKVGAEIMRLTGEFWKVIN